MTDSNFPSEVDSHLTDGIGGDGDALNDPSHPDHHLSLAEAIKATQDYILESLSDDISSDLQDDTDFKDAIKQYFQDNTTFKNAIKQYLYEQLAVRPEQFTVERQDKDDDDIFRTIIHRRHDGTKYSESVLGPEGDDPEYHERTVTWYEDDGQTQINSVTYNLTYDDDGDLVEESVQ